MPNPASFAQMQAAHFKTALTKVTRPSGMPSSARLISLRHLVTFSAESSGWQGRDTMHHLSVGDEGGYRQIERQTYRRQTADMRTSTKEYNSKPLQETPD
jgi:hypothetical protein